MHLHIKKSSIIKFSRMLFVISITACIGCSKVYRSKSIKLFYNLEFVNTENNEIIAMRDSLAVFYNDKYTVYKLPHVYLKPPEQDNNGNFLIDETAIERVGYEFVLHRKNFPYAYFLDSLTAEHPRKISIDSFLSVKAFKGFPFYSESSYKLYDSTYNNSTKILKETYIPIKRVNDTYPDTTHYYFTKSLNDIKYSFSPRLDSIIKLKLFKVELITNKVPGRNNGKDIPRRAFIFEVKRNTDDILMVSGLIDRFRKMKID